MNDRDTHTADPRTTPTHSADTEMATPRDDSIDKARLRASLMSKLFGEAPEAVRIGRFRVLERVGDGGMGVVYAAYDDQLDRKVAIKVLHAELSGGTGKARLLREAQALAQLAHPNVITVHEVGEHEGRVFVAMEFVRGQTLRTWRKSQERSIAEILDVYAQAGRGLAAAHAAGLVHRDFKPDNAIVGEDGRVRVLDFGLARPVNVPAERPAGTAEEQANALESSLTVTGTVMGTPAYMAPEQHEGRASDARSDQFSFCVALWEALYGEHPYAGDTVREIAASVIEGRLRSPSKDPGVSGQVRKALERGLRTDATERHPDLDALLLALGPQTRSSSARLWKWVAALAVLGAAAGFAFSSTRGPQLAELCKPVQEQLAGVWDEPVRTDLAAHFGTQPEFPWVRRSWEVFETRSQDFINEWSGSYEAACGALDRDPEDPALALQRVDCLETRLWEFDALLSVARASDPKAFAEKFRGWLTISPLEFCATTQALRAIPPLPRDPALRAELREIKHELLTSRMHTWNGRPLDGQTHAQDALGRVEGLDYPPIEAEALLALWEAQHRGSLPGEDDTRARALLAAERSSHEWVLARLLIYSEDESDLARARLIAEKLGTPLVLAPILGASHGHHALRTPEEIAWLDQVFRDRVAGRSEIDGVGMQLLGTTREASRVSFLAETRRLLGDDHPRTAIEMHNAAEQKKVPTESIELLEGGLAVLRAAYPDGHQHEGGFLVTLAEQNRLAGRFRAAYETAVEAEDLLVEFEGTEGPFVRGVVLAQWWYSYLHGDPAPSPARIERLAQDESPFLRINAARLWAADLARAARREEALALYRKSIDAAREAAAPDDRYASYWGARVFWELGDQTEARDHVEHLLRARAEAEQDQPTWLKGEHTSLAGKILFETGEPQRAIRVLEPAVAALEGVDSSVVFVPDAHFYLGRALVETNQDPVRGMKLARQGVDEYAQLGPGWAKEAEAARAWLKKHDG